MSKANLTENEKKLVSICNIEGYTEKEAAQDLRISQGQVSKLRTAITEKLSKVAHSSR